MALIKCPECGKEISNQAQACPHCGHPVQATVPTPPIPPQPAPAPKKKKGLGCLAPILIIFFLFVFGLVVGLSQATKNPVQHEEQSLLAKTMELDSSQEASMLKIFNDCGIGEITSASVFQAGEDQTSYYLEDAEVAVYRGAEYDIVVWVDNATKSIESIYFHSQDIYIDGEVLSPITAYYVNSADREKYRVSSQLAVQQLLNYPDSAEFPAIKGWAFGVEDGIVIVQSNVTAKNAFNMSSTYAFQVKFDSGNIVSLILDGTEYIK